MSSTNQESYHYIIWKTFTLNHFKKVINKTREYIEFSPSNIHYGYYKVFQFNKSPLETIYDKILLSM